MEPVFQKRADESPQVCLVWCDLIKVSEFSFDQSVWHLVLNPHQKCQFKHQFGRREQSRTLNKDKTFWCSNLLFFPIPHPLFFMNTESICAGKIPFDKQPDEPVAALSDEASLWSEAIILPEILKYTWGAISKSCKKNFWFPVEHGSDLLNTLKCV